MAEHKQRYDKGDTTRPRYIAYVRKSTEGEERQALSIETQIRKIREIFPHLIITGIIEERRSAAEPDNRPGFTQLLSSIEDGDADGIIAWHPDRLSRNEEEAAKITSRVRRGKILDLKFCSYNFDNSPEGIMMLQLALSQSQYFSSKLSKDVKRGIEQKLRLGQKPGMAPEGYLNDRDGKTIIPDPLRFTLVRRMWDLMLTGQYSATQIQELANTDWGYLTRQRGHVGGGPISRSSVYYILSNVFYAGQIRHKGDIYEGSHEPMVTTAEFDRVQVLLGGHGMPRKTPRRSFAYTGFIKCGECGHAITAEISKGHTYYHCTHRSKVVTCGQRTNVREERLESLFEEALASFTILPEFRDWALEALRESNEAEAAERNSIAEMQASKALTCQRQLDQLIDMRAKNLIDDDEYIERRDTLRAVIKDKRQEARALEVRADNWLEIAEKMMNFAVTARDAFRNGSAQERRSIVMAIGQNFTLADGKLRVEANSWLAPIPQGYPAIESQYTSVRTSVYGSSKAKTEALTSVRTNWLGR